MRESFELAEAYIADCLGQKFEIDISAVAPRFFGSMLDGCSVCVFQS